MAGRKPDPVVDEAAGVRSRQFHVGGAQMPEPAERMELARPFLVGGDGVENRKSGDIYPVAVEHPAAGVDVEGNGRVGGAEIDRRDQQPFGDRSGVSPAIEDASVQAKCDRASGGAKRKAHLPTLTGSASDRHRCQIPTLRKSKSAALESWRTIASLAVMGKRRLAGCFRLLLTVPGRAFSPPRLFMRLFLAGR